MPEALVALLLGLLVVHLGLRTATKLRDVQTELAVRADKVTALRVARHVLRRELRRGRPAADWGADGDSLWLRAFRGSALVCARDSIAAELSVTFSGDRAPDPSKDSVLVATEHGEFVARDLVGTARGTGRCDRGGSAAEALWRLDSVAPAGAVLARLFERGSYHLDGAALRYRRGRSGRQPLTPEVWSPATGWLHSGGAVGVELVPVDPGPAGRWRGFLAWTDPP